MHCNHALWVIFLVSLIDEQGKRHKHAMVQYLLDGPEVEIKVKPHGNSKECKPFFRTAGSTKRRIKGMASSYTPKEAVNLLTIQQGGELHAKGAASLPRDHRQIKYVRDRQQAKDPNPLYSIMLECKLAQGKSEIFVQDVKAAPQPACVLSTEWQLDDMVRFLTKNHKFGVLTIDTTYNLGEFYVTPVVYPHLMLGDINTHKPPLILGPIFVHQKVDFQAFNYFGSTLISLRRGLQHLMAFGTDGDKALVEAFAHNFPYAIQLRCFIHFHRNVEQKLKEFGIPSSVAEEFLGDIFGKRIGNTFQEGLVDSTSVDEVEERLHKLQPVWDARESTYSPKSGPCFHVYFCRYHGDVVKYHMRKDLRESAGLGSPPATFTTNSSESINTAIKRHVSSKESDWPTFNEKMKQLVHFQHEEIIRALSGRGQYRLRPEYQHLTVSTQQWMKMRPDQRQLVVDDFNKANIPQRSTTSSSQSENGKCLTPSITEMEECSTGDTSVAKDSSSVPDKAHSNSLHISAQDSGITTIPLVTLEGMWTKAGNLLSTKNSVTPAPGVNKKSRMVLSYSQVAPHLVQGLSGGQYLCDSYCPQWSSSQICSHVLAAAHDNGELGSFLSWYSEHADSPNISTLALSGLSRGRGRKGGQPKRQRKKPVPPPDNYTVRPGMAGPSSASEGSIERGTSPSVFTRGPPPLISVASTQLTSPIPQQVNVNPFFVKPLAGAIRICQGCRGSLRLADGQVPPPPFNMVIARLEMRPFRDSTGTLRTPSRPCAAHYHLRLACIRAADPNFISSTLTIPNDVALDLSSIHHEYLHVEFSL